jgi:hypothetical protein
MGRCEPVLAHQQDGPVRARTAQAHHDVPFAIVRAEDGHITRRKSGVAEALRHGFSSYGGAADRVRGVDLNKLLENVASQLPEGGIRLGAGTRREEQYRCHRRRQSF